MDNPVLQSQIKSLLSGSRKSISELVDMLKGEYSELEIKEAVYYMCSEWMIIEDEGKYYVSN